MFVALDATYLVDPHPSGIAVYSRELLHGLARDHAADRYLHLYRPKQFRRAPAPPFPNVSNRLLLPFLSVTTPWNRPQIFHALNQRVDKRPARRTVTTFHDLFVMTGEYSSREFRARFAKQARQAAARSDLIIAVSEFTKNQVISHLNIPSSRVRVIPHGIHLPEASNAAPRDNIILCVGAVQLRKNVSRLVQAFERLPPAIVKDWKLVLAGSTAGFGAAEIVARIEQSPLTRHIQLRGYVAAAELNDLYRRARVFAFPSLDEGFGIPVLEAMANGVPVLTSNRSALPEVAGDAAVTVDPYDVDAISTGLQSLIADQALRADLIARGVARAKLFPSRNTVEETYKIYQELAD